MVTGHISERSKVLSIFFLLGAGHEGSHDWKMWLSSHSRLRCFFHSAQSSALPDTCVSLFPLHLISLPNVLASIQTRLLSKATLAHLESHRRYSRRVDREAGSCTYRRCWHAHSSEEGSTVLVSPTKSRSPLTLHAPTRTWQDQSERSFSSRRRHRTMI